MNKDLIIQKQDELIEHFYDNSKYVQGKWVNRRDQLFAELKALKEDEGEEGSMKDIITQAHMAGQTDAGCKHSSYFNAVAYYNTLKDNPIESSSLPPQPGQFKKFSLLEDKETVTSSDTIIHPQLGRGADRKEIEDLMIIVWHGGQLSEHEGGISFEDSLHKDGSPIHPFGMTVKDVIDTLIQMIGEYRNQSEGEEPKTYDIDFAGNCMAQISVKGNKLEVIQAINGGGESLRQSNIIITEG